MRIAIDVSRANRPQRTGPGSYAWHVVRELVHSTQNKVHSSALLAPEGPRAEWGTLPQGVGWKKLRWVGPGWTRVRLPLHLAASSYDVFFQPSAGPVWLPRRTRGVVSIHDVAFLEAPDAYEPADLSRQRAALDGLKSSRYRVLTVSEHSRRQLVELAGISPDRITVTPLAADQGMSPQPLESVKAAMDRYGLRAPYVITVGRIERKKGTAEIVQALAQLPAGVQLALVGPDGYGADEVHRRVDDLGLRERVKFLGWVPDADLACLLCGATCYVSACRYEGFGIAVLDALACGCPVVAYRAGAVPETVGEAAVLVDSSGSERLAVGIRQLLDSPDTYHRLSRLSVERARQFSWRLTAELTASALIG